MLCRRGRHVYTAHYYRQNLAGKRVGRLRRTPGLLDEAAASAFNDQDQFRGGRFTGDQHLVWYMLYNADISATVGRIWPGDCSIYGAASANVRSGDDSKVACVTRWGILSRSHPGRGAVQRDVTVKQD